MKAGSCTLLLAALAVGCGATSPRAGGGDHGVDMASVRASLAALPALRLDQADVCALTDAPDFKKPALVLLAPGNAEEAWRLARPEDLTQLAPVIHCAPDRPAPTVSARVTCDAQRPVCTFALVSGGVAMPPFDRKYWFARRDDGTLYMVAAVISTPPWTRPEVPPSVAASLTGRADAEPESASSEGVVGGTVGGTLAGPETLPDGRTVFPFGAGMNRPHRVSGREIRYTYEAREANVEGVALVKCIIAVNGAVTDCTIVKGLPHMDAELLAAISTWRMTPVLMNGAPVAVRYTLPIRLKMGDSAPGWSRGAPDVQPVPFTTGMNRPNKLAGRLPKTPVDASGSPSTGVVRARCTIGPDGNLLACAITQGMPSASVEVLDALKGWRTTPVLLNGKAVTVGYQFEFVFGKQVLPPLADATTRFQVSR